MIKSRLAANGGEPTEDSRRSWNAEEVLFVTASKLTASSFLKEPRYGILATICIFNVEGLEHDFFRRSPVQDAVDPAR